eukprot:1147195-Pelagomonas_calceolata.AAC.2
MVHEWGVQHLKHVSGGTKRTRCGIRQQCLSCVDVLLIMSTVLMVHAAFPAAGCICIQPWLWPLKQCLSCVESLLIMSTMLMVHAAFPAASCICIQPWLWPLKQCLSCVEVLLIMSTMLVAHAAFSAAGCICIHPWLWPLKQFLFCVEVLLIMSTMLVAHAAFPAARCIYIQPWLWPLKQLASLSSSWLHLHMLFDANTSWWQQQQQQQQQQSARIFATLSEVCEAARLNSTCECTGSRTHAGPQSCIQAGYGDDGLSFKEEVQGSCCCPFCDLECKHGLVSSAGGKAGALAGNMCMACVMPEFCSESLVLFLATVA